MNLQEEQPFYKRHKFVGQFVFDEMTTDPVDVVVEFNELEGGRIDGVILDGGSSPEVAQQVFNAHKACRLVSHGDQWPTVEAEQVLVSKVTNFFGASSGSTGVVAEFSCSAVSETLHREGDTERGISFSLAGALGALEPREMPTESWTGERTVERSRSEFNLGVSWPGTIDLKNEYLWERSDGPKRGRYAYVPTLYLGCDVSRDELSDEAFLDKAKALVDDATLLMSFARRQWIVWYSYSFWTPEFVSQHRFHSSRDTRNQRHRIDDSPVGMKAAEFLRVCLPRFQERRANGEDLRLPIVYGVPKAGYRSVEERFTPAFWALEKLIAVLVNRENRNQILGTRAFDRLTQKVTEALKGAQIPEGRWGEPSIGLRMIRDKIRELNRPSIAVQLQWVCDSLDVTWRDLYPASDDSLKKPSFITTRNEIFHSNTPIDGGRVFRETCRVSLLFERLILKALGWSDLGSTGPRAARSPIDREL